MQPASHQEQHPVGAAQVGQEAVEAAPSTPSAGPTFAAAVFFATTSLILAAQLFLSRGRSRAPSRGAYQESPVTKPAEASDPAGATEPGLDLSGESTAELRVAAQEPREVTPRGLLTAEEARTIELFRLASPSVVHVATHRMWKPMWTRDVGLIPAQSGSGVVWDEAGYVVTSNHLVRDSHAAFVTLHDGSTWAARLVGASEAHDLAVLFVDAPRALLRGMALGSSADLQVGQRVFAIGNPFGMDQTLTSGLISGLDRSLSVQLTNRVASIDGVVQTDAAINPGSSGGPLLDSSGRMVGINTAIHSASDTYAGIGFAIPVDTVNLIVPHMIQHGHVPWPELGVLFAPDGADERLGTEGIVIISVNEQGPAARAGLRNMVFVGGQPISYDTVTTIDGCIVRRRCDVDELLLKKEPGETVALDVTRGDERLRVFVTLQESRGSRPLRLELVK